MSAINQSEVRKSSDSSATFTAVESRMKELNLEEGLESLRETQPNLAFEIENTPRPLFAASGRFQNAIINLSLLLDIFEMNPL